ncbi:hydrolase [Paenactinomyces guangxiensis]|uniref:Hydrolase n=1 Tax=Paenactinomyces guangxiensis TaxID=1490290 RepID=A0A7W1WU01_9BACL|nr:hypothetical protein [Paenactinomyces guangxiensis]MBA4495997.1 hypothetical protein [Paenactinomyces guangxiensis]MBH8593127.1 hypothetical protein [Paenactinomyces guangxiensis]
MEKKTYYVTVDIGPNAGEIREEINLNDAVYDFEIRATPEEISRLEKLFEETQENDFHTFITAHIPYETRERLQDSRREDEKIDQIYQMIYQLGTEETKRKMKQSGIIH